MDRLHPSGKRTTLRDIAENSSIRKPTLGMTEIRDY